VTVHPSTQYDVIAAEYADAFGESARNPADRDIVRRFARELAGPVIDVGCGPGYAAAELAETGLTVLGVDRSVAMVDVARRNCSARRSRSHASFAVADMFALPVPDSSCAAVCSWYSIVHTPAELLPVLFAEFRRVLTDPGRVLLAFQTGADTLELTSAFGREVHLRFLRHDVDVVLAALSDAGLPARGHTVRPRDTGHRETADQAFVIAG
jgi:SAM-dependent methyltransferase